MHKKSIDSYYFFGTSMRYLQDSRKGWKINESANISDNIRWFLDGLDTIELIVTKRASFKLYEFQEKLTQSPEENLTEALAAELSDIMKEIRLTLDAEIGGIEAFISSPKRYSTSKLFGDISSLFAPEVFNEFHDIAKFDFIEAGKCIVFERATAAAFHILRATEANLRLYYQLMVKQNKIQSRMWGPIVQDLRKKTKTKKHVALNNHLDNIRVSFRNPTQHPEATYDIHEAQDLLALCVDVNNRMFKVVNA